MDNQLSIKPATNKIKQPINNVELWSDAFINVILIYIQKHPNKVSELLKYLSVIRGAASNNPINKWLCYDMQFRLRMSKDPNKSWSQIDGHLWLSCGLSGDLAATTQSAAPCYEFNFKGSCTRLICTYAHVCLKCKVPHPASTCNLFRNQRYRPRLGYPHSRPAANFAQNDLATGQRPFRPSMGQSRPPRPFRQQRYQSRFMGSWRTPIKLEALRVSLSEYPNQSDAEFLLEGFSTGFRIDYEGLRLPTSCKNLISVMQNEDIALDKVMEEVQLGRIAGQFSKRPISNLWCSPVGLIPKKTGGFRLITHL